MTPLLHWFQEFAPLSFGKVYAEPLFILPGLVSLSIGSMHWGLGAPISCLGTPDLLGYGDSWAGEFLLARCEEGIGWTVGNIIFRIVADAGDYVGASDTIVPES